MKINFTMSSNIHSSIFDQFINYFYKYSDNIISSSINLNYSSDVNILMRPNLQDDFNGKIISIVHHDLEELDSWMMFDNFHESYLNSDAIICLNSNQKKILLDNKINKKKIFVIPHGYHSEFNKINFDNKSSQKILIGFFSRKYPRGVKGEVDLEELLIRLDTNKFAFVFYGNGRLSDHKLANCYGFESQFIKDTEYTKFIQIYSKLNILLILSYFEGGPASLPEALASKTFVITRNIGMATDFIVEGLNGFFIDDYNYDEIVKLLNKVASQIRSQRLVFIDNNKIKTWEETISDYDKVFSVI